MAKLQCLGGDNCANTPTKVCDTDSCRKPLCKEHAYMDPIDSTREICLSCLDDQLAFLALGPVTDESFGPFD